MALKQRRIYKCEAGAMALAVFLSLSLSGA